MNLMLQKIWEDKNFVNRIFICLLVINYLNDVKRKQTDAVEDCANMRYEMEDPKVVVKHWLEWKFINYSNGRVNESE